MDKKKHREIVDKLCDIFRNDVLLNHEDYGHDPDDFTCDSEIEAILYIYIAGLSHIVMHLYDVEMVGPGFVGVDECVGYIEKHGECNKIYVFYQVPIESYRVDFLFLMRANSGGVKRFEKLVVECDGHDFHEKTKLQAARDKGRDRYILKSGLPSMRFTGSEIWRDVSTCTDEIKHYFYERWSDLYNSERARRA